MEKLKTFECDLDFNDFKFVESLIYYDGDLLTLYEYKGESYLVSWYDCDTDFHRWLIFQINIEDLYEKTMYFMMKNSKDGKYHILDNNYTKGINILKEIKLEDLPEDCFYDEDAILEK